MLLKAPKGKLQSRRVKKKRGSIFSAHGSEKFKEGTIKGMNE